MKGRGQEQAERVFRLRCRSDTYEGGGGWQKKADWVGRIPDCRVVSKKVWPG